MTISAFRFASQFNPQARLFFAVVFGMGFGIEGVYNVLLNLFMLRLGYGPEFIGLINATGLLAFALTSLPAGLLGAKVSATRLMKMGGGMALLGATLLPMAEALPTDWRQSWLVFQYVVMLAGFAFFFVNGAPYLMNSVKTEQKTQAFAIKSANLSLAAFAGSLVGGLMPEIIARTSDWTLADAAPFRITLHLVAIVLAVAVLLLLRIRPLAREVSPTSVASAARDPMPHRAGWTMSFLALVTILTLIRLFQVAGSATAIVYFNVYMDTRLLVSAGVIGSIAAIGRLIGVPLTLAVPRMARRWGHVNVVIAGSLVTALCLLPLALVEHWLAAAIGYIGISATMYIRYTAFTVYMLDLVPKVQQSIMSGSGEMAAGFAFALMALGGGIVLASFSFRDLFLLGAALSLIGTLTFWWHGRRTNRKRKLAPA